jgi:Fe-S-cluster containining protein
MLARQANTVTNTHAWYTMPYEQRACPFLDHSTQNCKVYDDRPAVCRTNFAVSDPSSCDGESGELRLLNTDEANMILIGAYLSTKSSGELQKMIWNKLSEKLKEKSRKEDIFTAKF